MEKVTRSDLNSAFEKILLQIDSMLKECAKSHIADLSVFEPVKPYSITDYLKQSENGKKRP